MRKNSFLIFSMIVMALGLKVAAETSLNDFFESSLSVIPNKLSLSLYDELRWKDNVDDSHYKKSSFINEIGAKASFTRNIDNLKYGLKGSASYEYYQRHAHDMNEFNWDIAPFISILEEAEMANELQIKASSESRSKRIDTSETTRTRQIDSNIGLLYDINKHEHFGVALTADYRNYLYTSNRYKGRSYQKYGFGVAPYYKLSENTNLGFHASYFEKKYRNDDFNDDSSIRTYSLFLDQRLGRKLMLNVEGGVSKTDYEGVSSRAANDNKFDPVASATLTYTCTENLVFKLISEKEWEDSSNRTTRGGRDSWDNTIAAIWRFSPRFTLTNSFEIEQQNEKNGNSADTLEYIYSARLAYRFSEHVLIYTDYKYDKTEFKYHHNYDYSANEILLGLRLTY